MPEHQASELDWTESGPRSVRFDDVYFQLEDGLAESRAVFLAGCGLPDRFAGRRQFSVGELGFGTGLNMLALLDLWRRHRPGPDSRLHMVSIEAFPISADEAARVLSAFPELAELAAELLAFWPDGRRGAHWIDFPALGARLQLLIGEVAPQLAGLDARMDAWFLDGFAPSKNPDMWTEAVLGRVAALSAPGCVTATFTVAGDVRRRLADGGFQVEKQPGFGHKRERLVATLPGHPVESKPSRVAIIGAGIAGASLVRALRGQGIVADLFDRGAPGSGASGNAAALVTPRLDAGLGHVARLHAEAFARAVQIYRTEAIDALIGRGALQLEKGPKDAGRFGVIAGWTGFAPDGLQVIDPAETTRRLGETWPSGALRLRDALVLHPATVLEAFIADARVIRAKVTGVAPDPEGWRLVGAETLGAYDTVVVAAGPESGAVAGVQGLGPVRGQVTLSREKLGAGAAAWGGYVIPTRTGLLFGATHQRGDDDARSREIDDAANLAALRTVRPMLADRVARKHLTHRTAIRAATPDHLPLVGGVRPGLYVLAGLGGRGFSLAPLLAEVLAAELVGAPGPLDLALRRRLDPLRYAAPGSEE